MIELLVVIAIIAILTAMTAAAVIFGFAAERSRSAARQVQSYLEGARDRAIYDRHPVGVRFLTDPNVPNTSTSMVFIEEIVSAPTGFVTVSQDSGSGVWTATRSINQQPSGQLSWAELEVKGLIVDEDVNNNGLLDEGEDQNDNDLLDEPGFRIRIPGDDDGFWYTVQTVDLTTTTDPPTESVTFQPGFRELPVPGNYSYELELPPVVRPSQEPMLLPRGIAIDLNRSQLPSFWTADRRDVMFSPRGTVTGRAAAGGLIHFYIAESADVERLAGWMTNSDIPADVEVGNPAELVGDRVIVTLFPQTGAISSHPVDVTDTNDNGVCDDPFFFAETGEVAGE